MLKRKLSSGFRWARGCMVVAKFLPTLVSDGYLLRGHVYETVPPKYQSAKLPGLVVFRKTNGFSACWTQLERGQLPHLQATPKSRKMRRQFCTENGAVCQ